MAIAYRTGGGSVQWVSGGVKGDCLSPSHREYKQGFEDEYNSDVTVRLHGSQAYNRGVSARKLQRTRFEQSIQANKVMRELGLSKADWLHLKKAGL